MEVDKPTVPTLADELAAAYGLLLMALPFALRYIQSGAAGLEDQRWFWWHLELLSKYGDVVDELDEENSMMHKDLIERKEALEALGSGPRAKQD